MRAASSCATRSSIRGLALQLTEKDVDRLLSPADAIEAVEDSFLRLADGRIKNVPRYRLGLDPGFLAVMAAVDKERGLACVKQYSAGADAISFVVVLFEHGETKAVIEASRLGQLRTGAASAVAAKHLAKPARGRSA